MNRVYPFKCNNLSKMVLILFLIFSFNAKAQIFTDSNLPIVVITTDIDPITSLPLEIPDDPRVLGNMKIIKHPDGTRNYLTDISTAAYLNYNGRINIEIRGSSSQELPKKPYGLTTLLPDNISNNNVSLLGMPSENDWILNSLAFDPSLIRDYISYNISRQMNNYASRTVYCELVVNGEYVGLYLLQEKIKADTNRVNLLKITPTDITSPNLSGGYITKADKITGGDPVAWTMSSYIGITNFIHDLPKPEEVTAEQDIYIHGRFTSLATTSHANNLSLSTGFPSIIDIPSFVDFMLSNELASNADGYQLSTYFHKDRDGKLRAGPIWDFNLTYGNDLFLWGFDRSHYDVWQFGNGDNEGPKFWKDLFNNTTFKCYLSRRWNELTQTGKPMNYNSLTTLIDNAIIDITEASVREQQKWGTIPNLALEIVNLKSFLSQRIVWMNNNLGPFSACSGIVTPPLVITKINYNPTVTPGFPVSNDQEFIEIKNTGSVAVNLTGFYFRALGISYQFPANSTITANQSIFIASNSTVFQTKYGIVAFGQFTRNLSNKSQQLILADGFGNTIDSVEYFDNTPWPAEADGNGSYLQLISNSLDNSLASSWQASSTALSTDTFSYDLGITVYPNPVTSILNVVSKENIDKVVVYDVYGKTLMTLNVNSNQTPLDLNNLPNGFYFLKISNQYGYKVEKVMKQ